MPHFPKPFFKTNRKTWYVQIGTKQVNLGADKENAFRRRHEIMAKPDVPIRESDEHLVAQVFVRFADGCQKDKAERTYDWYKGYLQSLLDCLPPRLAVKDLRPFHVQQWLDSKSTWTTGRCGAVAAVQRPPNWAVRSGYISTNLIRGIERVEDGRRQEFLTAEQFLIICSKVQDRDFLDVLETCRDTGCRPNELMVVEAGHVDLAGGRWVLPPEKSKGKRRQRVVFLTDRALAISEG
jgi:integrase/recombinase XerD